MPFSRHPLDYPINRLYLHVGMALRTWICRLPRARTPEQRSQVEQEVAERLGLPDAVEGELLKRYRFRWGDHDRIRTIELIPHPRVRRTPGIGRLRKLFFE